jgi:hypothetical protein
MPKGSSSRTLGGEGWWPRTQTKETVISDFGRSAYLMQQSGDLQIESWNATKFDRKCYMWDIPFLITLELPRRVVFRSGGQGEV